MTSVTRGSATPSARPQWAEFLRIREVWGSLAISTMWLAVAVSAVWGADFVSQNTGSQTTTIPSGVFVAFFACIASAWVAKRAFR
jgi:hypothetical protein